MAKPFAPPVIQKEGTPPWLYNALGRLINAQRDAQQGLAAITRGEVPDSSGMPLLDLTKFFYLPGRPGNQTAYGGQLDGGFLKLRSTASNTKGRIYLGSYDLSAYDDTQQRLGLGTINPVARCHVQVAASPGNLGRPNGFVSTSPTKPWTNPFASTIPLVWNTVNEYVWPGVSDPSYCQTNGGTQTAGSYPIELNINDMIANGNSTGWQIQVSVRRVNPGAANINVTFELRQGSGTSVGFGTLSNSDLTSAFVNPSTTTNYTFVIPASAIAAMTVTTGFYRDLRLRIGLIVTSGTFNASGTEFLQWGWGQVQAPASNTTVDGLPVPGIISQSSVTVDQDLYQSQDSNSNILGGITPGGNLYVGTVAGLASTELYLVSRAATDIPLIIQGAASQSGSALVIQDSTATARMKALSTTTETTLTITTPASGFSRILLTPSANQGFISWGLVADFGPPKGSSDVNKPCPGTRLQLYHDSTNPQSDNGYGQDTAEGWILIDGGSNYSIYTGDTTAVARKRATWGPNGDMQNFGEIHISKFTVGTTGLTATAPRLRLDGNTSGTLTLQAAASTTSHTLTMPAVQGVAGSKLTNDGSGNLSWSLTSTVNASVNLTAQGATVGPTTLASAAGYYLVSYTLETTTADGTAGTIQFQVSYTDDIGATTQLGAALTLTATGRDRGQFQVYLASGNLQYQTNLAGIFATAKYALRVRVQYLG